MGKHRDRVCGADVHKDLIVAKIAGGGEDPIEASFGTTKSELKRFEQWLIANKCKQVAFEATGVYWMPVHDLVSLSIDTIVANPWQIRTIPNDKSDAKDADRISELCINGQIKRSRVFCDEDRDLRTLTRTRSGYVRMRTQIKNRIHKHLSSHGIKLSSCIEDIFGKSGRYILNGLVNATNIHDILKGIPSGKVRKKEDLLRASLCNSLNEVNRHIVGDMLNILDNIDSKIEDTSRMIMSKLQPRIKDLAIVMSIPGIGFVAGSTILAEIGDYHDFETPKSLVKWSGLNPGENETAGKKKSCGITKRGSKYLRTMLTEVAHVIAKSGNSRLSKFFQRLRARKNYNVAITALSRKILCLIHHLLTNQEMYQEDHCEKRRQNTSESDNDISSSPDTSLDDKASAIVDAFYHLKGRKRKNVLRGRSGSQSRSSALSKRLSVGDG
jgi:transposase